MMTTEGLWTSYSGISLIVDPPWHASKHVICQQRNNDFQGIGAARHAQPAIFYRENSGVVKKMNMRAAILKQRLSDKFTTA
jgi:hypothetical protein